MRIVFMGTPEFAVPSLEALLRSEHPVVGVVTQPDRPKGRGGLVTPSPVKSVCQREGIALLQPEKMKALEFLDALRAWLPDLIVVAAFGRILSPVILDLPPRGCINVHASLLPKYRDAGPIQWAIINGDRETGVTTMLMDAGMDTGAILLQEPMAIEPNDTAGTLSVRLAALGGRLLIRTVDRWQRDSVTPQPQDHSKATLAPLLKKEDGAIDWNLPATVIANRVRGLSPWPGAYTYAGYERWTIWRASPVSRQSDVDVPPQPGTVVGIAQDAILVAAGESMLEILELQPANGRRMTASHYVAGHRLSPNTILSAQPAGASKSQ